MSDTATATPPTLHLKLKNDVSIVVPNDIENYATYVLLEQNEWFEDEAELVREFLRPGMNAIDIGANHGFYSLTMAKQVGESGNVWAFEPNPRIVGSLEKSKSLNGFKQLHPHSLALSDLAGKAFLSDRDDDVLNQVFDQSPDESSLSIDTQTLDGLSGIIGDKRIDFVKIDAEGHEFRIIAGGRNFFARQSPLVMLEIKHGIGFEYAGMDALTSLGYRAYRYIKLLGAMIPLTMNEIIDPYTLNVLCCKDDRAAILEKDGLIARLDKLAFFTPLVPLDSWRTSMIRDNYSRPHVANWISETDKSPLVAWASYEQALNLYCTARDKGEVPAERRYRLWEQALVLLSQVFQQQVSLPRIFTASRIMLEIGQRNTAVNLMNKAIEILIKSNQFEMREPFLPPLPRYDDKEIGASMKEWMLSCVLEGLETVKFFTSFISRNRNLEGLDYIVNAGYSTPDLQRRRALIRFRLGLSNTIEYPTRPVSGEEEPNFAFWNAVREGEIRLARKQT